MKFRLVLAFVVAAAATVANQETFSFERNYKVGDKDSYVFQMSIESGLGSVDITTDMTQTVSKVYENGDADVESATTNTKVLVNGQPSNTPEPAKETVRMNKYGLRVKSSDVKRKGGFGGIGDLTSVAYEKPLSVGQEVTFDRVDPENPKTKSSGVVKLESIEKGVAKLISRITIMTEGQPKPMKLNLTSYMDVATAKPNKIEGTVSGMQLGGQGGMEIEVKSVTISFVRK